MGVSGISKSQVSRLCEEIDATYLKVRQNGRIDPATPSSPSPGAARAWDLFFTGD